MDYRIFPPEELIEDGVVDLPLSKSILNRELILASLTPGCPLPPAVEPECVDIAMMRRAVETVASNSTPELTLNVGESGTALRFVTALLAVRQGCEAVITGEPGLLKRPVRGLVSALRQLGATIDYLGQEGYAPLRVRGCSLDGGEVEVDATISSQFVSALMMIAPTMKNGLKISFQGEPISLPYIKMTASLMSRWGASVEMLPLSIDIRPGEYCRATQLNEGDWSSAAFWYEVVVLTAGWINLRPLLLPSDSVQGDKAAADLFGCLGVVTGPSEEVPGAVELSPSPEVYGRLDLDLSDNPDLVPALVVTCCMLGVPFKFEGLKTLGIKETDRLQALTVEMEKVGCEVEKIRDYGLEWDGKRRPIIRMPELDSHGDHRMAMAFAPTSVFIPGVIVRDVECVDKSYPGYWDSLRGLGFQTFDAAQPLEDCNGLPANSNEEEGEE